MRKKTSICTADDDDEDDNDDEDSVREDPHKVKEEHCSYGQLVLHCPVGLFKKRDFFKQRLL